MGKEVKLAKHPSFREGSREHVISWLANNNGVMRQCSCPTCEVNGAALEANRE